jgi:phosphatidylglycerophosphatase A
MSKLKYGTKSFSRISFVVCLNTAMRSILKQIATLGPVGFFPVAPGTFGTLVALAFVAITNLPAHLYLALTATVIAIGIYSSSAVEEITDEKDPGCIVIDEVAGYFVSMAFLPATIFYLVSSFVLFRIFDILKPPPLDRLQRLKGGTGVMADDILAGIYTNIILQIWKILS